VLEHLPDGVLVVDPAERVLWANRAFLQLYGLDSIADTRGQDFELLYRQAWAAHPQAPVFQASLQTLRENQRFTGAPFELALPDQRWVRVVEQRGGGVDGRGYFVHVDITLLKRQQQALREAEARARRCEDRYRLLATHSSDVTLAVVRGRISYVSPSVQRCLGWRPEQLEGRPISEFCHPEDLAGAARRIGRNARTREVEHRAQARHADGGHVWVELRARRCPADADTGTPAMLVVNLRNITVRKTIEQELEQTRLRLQELAVTDGLTGLANRRRFDEALEEESRRAQREASPLSLLLIDVDDFKAVNDRHGHPAGDEVLRQVARSLRRCAERAGELAARYGGEEFALLLPGSDAEAALRMAERVRRAIGALPSQHLGRAVSVSIGVACGGGRAGRPAAALLARADQALYAAKRGGKNRAVLGWEGPAEATAGPGTVAEPDLACYH
jgi:diguanylate cyclase (GGDEF)-like protein/PAS domain S-box-containing protein